MVVTERYVVWRQLLTKRSRYGYRKGQINLPCESLIMLTTFLDLQVISAIRKRNRYSHGIKLIDSGGTFWEVLVTSLCEKLRYVSEADFSSALKFSWKIQSSTVSFFMPSSPNEGAKLSELRNPAIYEKQNYWRKANEESLSSLIYPRRYFFDNLPLSWKTLIRHYQKKNILGSHIW